jgi:hypothetical protein
MKPGGAAVIYLFNKVQVQLKIYKKICRSFVQSQLRPTEQMAFVSCVVSMYSQYHPNGG